MNKDELYAEVIAIIKSFRTETHYTDRYGTGAKTTWLRDINGTSRELTFEDYQDLHWCVRIVKLQFMAETSENLKNNEIIQAFHNQRIFGDWMFYTDYWTKERPFTNEEIKSSIEALESIADKYLALAINSLD